MRDALAENLQRYLDKIKESEGIKFKGDAVGKLIEKLDEELEIDACVTPRTVQNWLDGKKKPELDKLIALSNIMHVSLDELLKDVAAEVQTGSTAPAWYENLSDGSKALLRRALEPYITGVLTRQNLAMIENREMLRILRENPNQCTYFFPRDEVEKLPEEAIREINAIFNGVLVDFYFEVKDGTIHTEKAYTKKEMVERETQKNREKVCARQISEYLKYGGELSKEKLFRLTDIGYFETSEYGGGDTYFDDDENIISVEEDGEVISVRWEEKETDSYNEIPYYLYREPNYQCSDTDRARHEIEGKLFAELVEQNALLPAGYGFDIMIFWDEKHVPNELREESFGDYYLGVRYRVNLDLQVIQRILTYELKRDLKKNVGKIGQAIDLARENAAKQFERYLMMEQFFRENKK